MFIYTIHTSLEGRFTNKFFSGVLNYTRPYKLSATCHQWPKQRISQTYTTLAVYKCQQIVRVFLQAKVVHLRPQLCNTI